MCRPAWTGSKRLKKPQLGIAYIIHRSLQIVAAVDDARVEQRGEFGGARCPHRAALRGRILGRPAEDSGPYRSGLLLPWHGPQGRERLPERSTLPRPGILLHAGSIGATSQPVPPQDWLYELLDFNPGNSWHVPSCIGTGKSRSPPLAGAPIRLSHRRGTWRFTSTGSTFARRFRDGRWR